MDDPLAGKRDSGRSAGNLPVGASGMVEYRESGAAWLRISAWFPDHRFSTRLINRMNLRSLVRSGFFSGIFKGT